MKRLHALCLANNSVFAPLVADGAAFLLFNAIENQFTGTTTLTHLSFFLLLLALLLLLVSAPAALSLVMLVLLLMPLLF